MGKLQIVMLRSSWLIPCEGAGYFFPLRCLTSKITSIINATINVPKVSISIIASNVVIGVSPPFRLEYNYPPSVEASPKTKKSVPSSRFCVNGIISLFRSMNKLFSYQKGLEILISEPFVNNP